MEVNPDGSPGKALRDGEEEGLEEEMAVEDSNWQDRNKKWVKKNTGEWFCGGSKKVTFFVLRGVKSTEYKSEWLEWIKKDGCWWKWMGRRGLERFLKKGADEDDH